MYSKMFRCHPLPLGYLLMTLPFFFTFLYRYQGIISPCFALSLPKAVTKDNFDTCSPLSFNGDFSFAKRLQRKHCGYFVVPFGNEIGKNSDAAVDLADLRSSSSSSGSPDAMSFAIVLGHNCCKDKTCLLLQGPHVFSWKEYSNMQVFSCKIRHDFCCKRDVSLASRQVFSSQRQHAFSRKKKTQLLLQENACLLCKRRHVLPAPQLQETSTH